MFLATPAACAPRAGPGKPVNINVLLEHTGPARGPEVSVALHTAELHPPRGQSSPEVSILGFCTLTRSLQPLDAPLGHWLRAGSAQTRQMCRCCSCFHRIYRLVIFAAGTCLASHRNLENTIPKGMAPATGPMSRHSSVEDGHGWRENSPT